MRSGESHFYFYKGVIIAISKKYDRKKPKADHLINKAIPFAKVFLLDEQGTKLGIKSKYEALKIAESKSLDLVVISNNPKQPVAKILDYGRFKYERKKRRKEAKSKQHIVENKEVRLTPMIGIHDLEVKAKKAREFLLEGHRVKVSLKFRGRELARKELGYEKHKVFLTYVEDIAKIDKKPAMNGNNFLDMYLSRDKTKKSQEEKKDGKE